MVIGNTIRSDQIDMMFITVSKAVYTNKNMTDFYP